MTTEIKPFFIKVITPLHVGSGSDLGVVDLPIQREAHTGFPKIEASSLKGAIRSEFENKAQNGDEKKKIHIVFGCDDCEKELPNIFTSENKDFSGALGFSDARILFFPVKSVKGVFAYITCPMVLKRFKDDIAICGKNIQEGFDIPLDTVEGNECIILDDKCKIDNTNSVILEEYSFTIKETKTKDYIKIPNLDIENERIVIVSDDNFTHFVKNSTDVITRTKIDNITGTVAQGALFTEEYLPSETVMYSLAIANKPFNNESDLTDENSVMKYFTDKFKENNIIQIGGNSTLGKGIVKISCEGYKK
jgi:CRISPR-associated protein Cmr4